MLTRSEFELTILQASLASVHVLLFTKKKQKQEKQVLIWKTKEAVGYHYQLQVLSYDAFRCYVSHAKALCAFV